MTKKKIILLVILIPVIFIGYLWLFPFGGIYFMELDYRLNKAISKNDLKLCDEFGDEKGAEYGYLRDRCYRFIAQKTNDVAICDKIATRPSDGTYYSLETENGQRDDCYRWLSRQKKDSSICDKMISEDNKTFCKNDIEKK